MPHIHYMVKLDDRLDRIRQLYVDRGKYFVINRARQYGKTTTLLALADYLKKDYIVLFLDFQKMSTAAFENENRFAVSFARNLAEILEKYPEGAGKAAGLLDASEGQRFDINELFVQISCLCKAVEKPVVLIIDEADSAANNQVFLDFLSQLRGCYMERETRPVFRSVILAGVYDVKNFKLKIRPEEEHKYNSPWNIAARFHMDMSFSAEQIEGMLKDYEMDHRTGMDTGAVSKCIYEYTAGYPYLVSAVCKFLDEEVPERKGFGCPGKVWTKEGIGEAVKLFLGENNSLFDSMVKQLDIFQDLRKMIEEILYQGKQIPFSPYAKAVNLGVMFGFLKEQDGHVAVANRIFEMGLLNLFMTEEAIGSEAFRCGEKDRNVFLEGGRLNMELVLERFVVHYHDIYGDNDEKFVEEYGRKFFLLYLKPIVNGVGNYYIEAQTRDARRTDVVVDYRGEQFVVELKIWHGNEYNKRGEKQLTDYLDYFRQDKGYMVSFNFNKKKTVGVRNVVVGRKVIVEAVV